MSLLGSKVAPFVVDAYQDKKGFIKIDSANFQGKWQVLFFYPADFTFVCPTELEDLAEHYDELVKLGVEVYGVSTDTHFTHFAWHTSSPAISKVKYALIADPAHKISRLFGCLDEESGLAQRATYVIDPDGVIQMVEINADGVGRKANELVAKIKGAISVRNNPGEACPAKWEDGAKTLKPGIDLVGKI
jgi:peroxiredoxin (alkyl hydroperoxide reductase subunit C)